MILAQIETPEGKTALRLFWDEHRRITDVQFLSEERQQDVLEWLRLWMMGKTLDQAYTQAPEQLLLASSAWGLKEARFVDLLLKEALYQTHKKVEIFGITICKCKKVSKDQLDAVVSSCSSLEELKALTKAGTGCGKCVPDLTAMLEKNRARPKRWHDRPNSYWIEELQLSLERWVEHSQKYPPLSVKAFQAGVVTVSVDGRLNGDQEWELTQELAAYWAEGLPEPVGVFLAFS
jgi:bacterioferritin-associated ferredoxin